MTSAEFIQQTRSGDYDRFLAIQRAPVKCRASLYVLAAFSVELARIAEIVSEPLIGHIRLAWWREALEEIAAGKAPRNHPLVLALAEIYSAQPEIFRLLLEIIEARAADLDTSLLAEETAWEAYCEQTAGALHLAFAMVMDASLAKRHASTIRKQGKAFAMVGLLRAIPFMTAQGWMRFSSRQLDAYALNSLEPSVPLPDFVRAIASEALGMLERGEVLPRAFRPLKALAALSKLSAQQLQRAGYDPYHLRESRLAAVWRVMRA